MNCVAANPNTFPETVPSQSTSQPNIPSNPPPEVALPPDAKADEPNIEVGGAPPTKSHKSGKDDDKIKVTMDNKQCALEQVLPKSTLCRVPASNETDKATKTTTTKGFNYEGWLRGEDRPSTTAEHVANTE